MVSQYSLKPTNGNLSKSLLEPSLKKLYFTMNHWLFIEKYCSLLPFNAIIFLLYDKSVIWLYLLLKVTLLNDKMVIVECG